MIRNIELTERTDESETEFDFLNKDNNLIQFDPEQERSNKPESEFLNIIIDQKHN